MKNRELDEYYKSSAVSSPCETTTYENPYASYNMDDETRRKVYKHISQHIGRYWRDLGRQLDFVEGEMDDLEGQKRAISDRIPAMLDTVAEQCATDRFAVKICMALRDAGQTKLFKDVQRILNIKL